MGLEDDPAFHLGPFVTLPTASFYTSGGDFNVTIGSYLPTFWLNLYGVYIYIPTFTIKIHVIGGIFAHMNG